MMLIATFNCNSVRMRLEIILGWLDRYKPDVLALQETKCQDKDFPHQAFTDAGWHVAYRGQKSYNGVAMITRRSPDAISFGLQDGDDGESDPRMACVTLGDVHILNTYIPQGREIDSEHFRFKLDWFSRLKAYLQERFDPEKSMLVWVGDLNVAPAPIDVYDSRSVWPHVCHCQQVIDSFQDILSWGFVDIFRKHLPGEGIFTFWDYRAQSVARNIGWRIDHILATAPIAKTSAKCFVDIEPRKAPKPSDHTFVAARFEICNDSSP